MSTTRSLDNRNLWLAFGWALVFAVIYLSLTPIPPTIDIEQGDKYGHILAYGTLMVWFAQIHAARLARVWLALAFVALGIGLEFVQGLTAYRTFEIADMIADGIGVLAGWIAAPPRLPNFLLWVEARLKARAGF